MANYGSDKAISMGGALPGQVVNGLVDVYDRLKRGGAPVFVVATFETDYVKTYPNGDKPDEPVLKLTRVEVTAGEDEATVLALLDRLQAARNGERTLATVQGELGVG